MANERKKHKILGFLFEISSNQPTDADPYGGSLTPSAIHIKFGYELAQINASLDTLLENKHVSPHYDDLNGLSYRITDKGKVAYNEQYYLNRLWYRSPSIWFNVVTLIISIAALIVSIFKD